MPKEESVIETMLDLIRIIVEIWFLGALLYFIRWIVVFNEEVKTFFKYIFGGIAIILLIILLWPMLWYMDEKY